VADPPKEDAPAPDEDAPAEDEPKAKSVSAPPENKSQKRKDTEDK
jgi:hypothetical protein